MIAVTSLENICPDLFRYEKIARILAQELPGLALSSEPLDIIDSLEHLADEMSQMPEVIQDCRQATEVMDELDQTIDRMFSLADRAAELSVENDRGRFHLNEEFKGYAHIVARLAGADDYEGPSLSLASQAEALAARKVLGYLNDARRKFSRKLDDQRRQINQAMDEALSFLGRIVDEADDLSHANRDLLQDILDRLAIYADWRLAQDGFVMVPKNLH